MLSKNRILCRLLAGAVFLIWLTMMLLGKPKIPIPKLCGQRMKLEGTVSSITAKTDSYQNTKHILCLTEITFCDSDLSNYNKLHIGQLFLPRNVLCTMGDCDNREETARIGERIVIEGKAEAFSHATNPGCYDEENVEYANGNAFALTSCRILGRDGEENVLLNSLAEAALRLGQHLDEICGADAGIMRAILLGDRSNLDADRKKLYQEGGIIHVLSVSGLHMTFLGMGLYFLLRKMLLPLPVAATGAGTFLLLFAVMTGMAPSAFRASFMFLCILSAEVTRRSYDRLTALSFSAMLLCLVKPYVVFHMGFLLSYSAILGITLFLPIVEEYFPEGFAKYFGASISIQIVTMPILLMSMYEIPVFSVILNLFVVPAMGIVMGLGVLSLTVGMASVMLAKVLFLPVHFLLACMEWSCKMTEKIPFSHWIAGKPAITNVILFYAMLLFLLRFYAHFSGKYVGLCVLSAIMVLTGRHSAGLSVTMLDVGQGQAVAVSTMNGKHYLLDAGSASKKKIAEYILHPYFKSQGITYLDAVFLSHTDADHYSGIEELLLEGDTHDLKIGCLVLPLTANREKDAEWVRLAKEAKEAGIQVYCMAAGDRVWDCHPLGAGETFTIECLHPTEAYKCDDKNSASLVLALQTESFCMLDMGDCDMKGEEALMRYTGLHKIDAIAVGHHGSKTSSGEAFLRKVRPTYALISVGLNNRYGHPAKETIARLRDVGCDIFATKDEGAVLLKRTPDSCIIELWKK